ncbi:MAG: TonB-dependent receptor [Bacteroidota bacterium]
MNRIFAFLLLSAAATSAHAQTDSLKTFKKQDSLKVYTTPSITVTSTRAEDRKSPVPFAEITKAELENIYTVQDVPALLSDLPSTYFYSESGNGVGYNKMTMRGFDQRRIAVMINGVPQNDPEDHNVYWLDFPDIGSSLQNIQVQRGAGLSSYGAAAIGGSVNLTTSNFTTERSIRVSSGVGIQEYGGVDIFKTNVQKYSLELSSGLTDNYAFYARLSRINSLGYREHSAATLNSYFLSAARFDDDVTTQINVFGGPLEDELTYYGVPKTHVKDLNLRRKNYSDWQLDSLGTGIRSSSERRNREIENFSQPHYELLNDIFLKENLVLKSTIFYYTGEGFFDYDPIYDGWRPDAATLRLNQVGFADTITPGNSIIRGFVGNHHGGWLPRIVWSHEGGELTLGAEARLHRSEHWGKIAYAENLPSGFDPDFKMYSYNGERDIFSFFAREQYEVLKDVLVNAEAQIIRHSYRIRNEKAGNNFTNYQIMTGGNIGNGDELFDVNFLFINPRLGVNWNATENLSAFTSVAFTSREPRMANLYNADESIYGGRPLFKTDTSGRIDFSSPLVKPERLLDIELGSRYRDENYSAGINFYWMEFFDELVKVGQLDIFGNPIDGNAPRTRHTGIELEANSFLFKSATYGNLQLGGNATFSQNRIIEYNFLKGDGTSISLADNPISGFPDILGNLILTYNIGEFNTRIIGKYVGGFKTDLFGDMKGLADYADNDLDAYTVVNFDASYDFKNVFSLQFLKGRVQVTNLLNNLYAAGAEGRQFFPGAERNVYFGVELGL